MAKGAFDFGKNNLLGSAGMYLVQQTDRIFLNIFFPRNIVGQYGFAWSNAAAPFNYLVMPQQQLILTYITSFKKNDPLLFERLLVIQRLITIIFYPILAVSMFYTEDVIRVLFSERWLEVAPIVRILLLYYSVLSIIFPYNSLLTGLGFPQINARLVLIKASILIPLLLLVSVLFKSQLIPYLVVFCIVSITFDLIKSFLGIKKTGVMFNNALRMFTNEIVLVFILLIGYILNHLNFIHFIHIYILAGTLLLYFILLFIIDKERTRQALKLIIKR